MPNMREKIKEYIVELDAEIKRCEKAKADDKCSFLNMKSRYEVRCMTLTEVIYDLQSILDEMVE